MRKILAMLLAVVMVLGLCACGGNSAAPAETTAAAAETTAAAAETTAAAAETTAAAENADDVPDEMTSSDGKYEIAFVTDVGQLKDKSFNQGTFDGVKLYAANAGKSYKYYQPAGGDQATDDDRYDAMKLAVENGAKVVVCAGFMQGTALQKAAEEFTDTRFVFIDGWALGLSNVAGIAFQEEQCGYLAGYAAVMDGYTKLGFTGGGGGANAACDRYGYGFVQGADAAAKEIGATDVNIKYWYSGGFAATDEVKNKMDGWYSEGTEVVFACGGPVCQSCDAAAQANGGKMIGVDVDQSGRYDTVITSAMKGLAESVNEALTDSMNNGWKFTETYAGKETKLGAAENCVGLPMETSKFNKFTQEQYDAMYASIVDGTLTIDDSFDITVTPSVTNVTVDYQG